MDGVQGYDEDQIALVVPDLSNFMAGIPVILGAPTISCIINVMKERDRCLGNILGKCQGGPSLVSMKGCGHSGRPPAQMSTMKWSSLRIQRLYMPFSSHVIPMKAEKAYTGEHISIMTQALLAKDSSLPQGLTVQNA